MIEEAFIGEIEKWIKEFIYLYPNQKTKLQKAWKSVEHSASLYNGDVVITFLCYLLFTYQEKEIPVKLLMELVYRHSYQYQLVTTLKYFNKLITLLQDRGEGLTYEIYFLAYCLVLDCVMTDVKGARLRTAKNYLDEATRCFELGKKRGSESYVVADDEDEWFSIGKFPEDLEREIKTFPVNFGEHLVREDEEGKGNDFANDHPYLLNLIHDLLNTIQPPAC